MRVDQVQNMFLKSLWVPQHKKDFLRAYIYCKSRETQWSLNENGWKAEFMAQLLLNRLPIYFFGHQINVSHIKSEQLFITGTSLKIAHWRTWVLIFYTSRSIHISSDGQSPFIDGRTQIKMWWSFKSQNAYRAVTGENALIGYDNCLIFSPLNAHPAVKFVINHPQRDVFGEIFTTNVTYIYLLLLLLAMHA